MSWRVLILAVVITCVLAQDSRVDVGVSSDARSGRLHGGFTRDFGNGFSLGVRGHVDTNRNWGASIGGSWRFRKRRSTEQVKYFTLRVDANQCNFNLYDVNRDGVITKEELVAVFGDNQKTAELFEALDIFSGDGMVDKEEFVYTASRTVEGC